MSALWRWVVGAVLLVGASPVVAKPSSSLRDYAILGLQSVALGASVRVEGGAVGVNSKSGAVVLAARARVDGTVAADTIRFGRSAQAGDLFCATFDRVYRTSASCQPPPALPLVDVLPVVQADPGTEDVRLGRLDTRNSLPAGRYGVVRVGDKGHLGLAGGEYDFRYLRIGRRGELLCEGSAAPTCLIRVKERMVLGEHGTISASPPLDARAMRIEIAGRGPIAAFRAYRRSVVDATIYAPNGHILLGMSGRYQGAFIGDSVDVLGRSRVVAASAF